jgi:hypothetical protein
LGEFRRVGYVRELAERDEVDQSEQEAAVHESTSEMADEV